MSPLFAEIRWEEIAASCVIGLGAGLISTGVMGLLPKRPPPAVGEDAATTPPRAARMSKPLAFLLMAAGVGLAVVGLIWRTSLPPF